MASTESIYAALFALASLGEGLGGAVSWTPPVAGDATTFAWTSRRLKTWDDVPASPALCQAEHTENIAQTTGLPSVTTLGANWVIYLKDGKDPTRIPAQSSNAVLDAVKALFGDPDNPFAVPQTLGGLVHKAWIEGTIGKAQGDLDGDTMLWVPIKILVP